MDAMIPITGAALSVVPKKFVGMTLVSCGEPGKLVIVKVAAPANEAAMDRWRGRLASLNSR
jgi:hypothetical protein